MQWRFKCPLAFPHRRLFFARFLRHAQSPPLCVSHAVIGPCSVYSIPWKSLSILLSTKNKLNQMGTEERDWVDVANDLICKCHINLRIQRLTECDASVFVALYEAILGEKVPDYIAAPKSQEDDIHNVQSVIDSLALDYLQISLSHITGENIVRGDKDSIRNLLEIFDGLLEYLTEQLSEEEELQNGELNGTVHPAEAQDKEEKMSQISSTHSTAQSSKYSLHSWNGGESESTAELIRLGDSARTFTTKQEGALHSQTLPSVISTEKAPNDLDPPAAQPPQQLETVHSAIPLQPPKQTTPHRVGRPPSSPPPAEDNGGHAEGTNKQNGQSPKCNGVQTNGIHTSAESEQSVQSLKETQPEAPKAQVEGGSEGARRVLFPTQPDVLLLSLPREHIQKEDVHTHARAEEVQSDEERLHSSDSSSGRRRGYRSRRLAEESEDPLSRRSQKNRQAEQELHEMSENLARRLEELDLMLKRALGETADDSKPADEDKHSHHSDSVMECRRVPRPADKASVDRPPHTRSLSPSPPPVRHSSQSMLEGAPFTHTRQHTARRRHDKLRHIQDQHRKGQMVAEAYEAELKNLDEQQKVDLAIERLRAQEAEREYREAINKEASRSLKSYNHRSKSTLSSKSPHSKAAAPMRPRAQTRKTAPLRVKENELLPALLDDFPPLQFSPHALSRMWKQQLRQVDQLSALDNQHKHTRKHTNQLEEAQKRHDLLMDILRKEQEHNRRLKDFRERIQQQRSSQNKLREQRQQVARARKYHSDYHVQLRARLLRARTREERMFRQVFEEGLELQKAQLREQRAHAKEQRREHVRKHKDEIEAMENYYKDQFSMLAERLALERQEIQVRKKAQEKALHKMKRELRSKMEREISELQKIIVQDDEEDYFRELEVERLRRRVQMASFQYGTSCTY
ncbi:centrosomal protein of 95 kDa-like isoform X3 [Hemibagrus wyckioides]|uniref:centrosomal protein of 95 kDa-like isoform X3 n=1 Tax=Hemibagrus wyckioides TaxID=337641 RepID=UPI00266BDAD0|nr:centrosomal protein of 95 kDa-like isoform X3 [Hemibagrus wyckioides]